MQTALLDSFALLPIAASIVLHSAAGFLLVRIKSKSPEKIPGNGFYVLGIGFITVMLVAGVAALFITGSFILSLSVFLASIFSVLFMIALASLKTEKIEQAEHIIEDTEETTIAEKEDPLVKIGHNFLLNVAESLTTEVNPIRLLDYINETQIASTRADGGVVFLTDDFDDIITSKSFKGSFPPPYKLPQDLPHKPVRVETNFRYVQFNLGESVFGEVAANGKPMLIPDGTADKRVHVNGPEEFLVPGSYIIVPLIVRGRVVGVSGVSRNPGNPAFGESEFRIAQSVGEYGGAAINNIYGIQEVLEQADLEREASIAAKIQKTLHPKRLPELPEVGFGSFFNSAKGVCGDYYDIILARRDRIAVVIGDVAGKGIQSSMVMMMVRSILQLVTNTTKNAGTILDWVNKGITGKIDLDHYATLSFVSYSPDSRVVEFASAGHQAALVWHADTKKMDRIHQKSDPIGIERASQYETTKLTVGKGDIIILFTDGLIEALNTEGKQYGIDSLSEIVKAHSGGTAKDIAKEVKQNIQAFLGSATLHDDQTLVIMKIKA